MTESVKPLRVLLAGGGTAGHVNPLLATAAALRDPALGGDVATEILVLGTAEGLEARLVPEAGYELAFVPKVPLPRKPSTAIFALPSKLRAAHRAAVQAISRLDADVVVGYGGYVSTPAYLAARSAGIPMVIHEQNARPGLANRLGARWAAAVALTFASTPLAATKGQTVTTGLPLRPDIAALAKRLADPAEAAKARQAGMEALGLDSLRPMLLVTGGSLGAQRLNEVLTQAAPQLLDHLQILHLTGRGKDAPVREAVAQALASGALSPDAAAHYHVRDYLSDMASAYAGADGVICRSGAGTVAELTALGLPALYVPLPIGNGEQRLNAADVVAAGGGKLVEDAALSAADIVSFAELLSDSEALAQARQAAASVGERDGAQKLAGIIRRIASAHRQGEM